MNKITTQETRKMIHHLSTQGLSCSLISEQLKLGISVVKKWRWRTSLGDYGSPMGRPALGPLSSFPLKLASTLEKLRKAHPGWGPAHLLLELKKEGRFKAFPSSASVGRHLSVLGLCRAYKRHGGVQENPMPKTRFPHECLGIQLKYSRLRRPTDQGIVERSHQTTRNQALKGQHFKNWEELSHSLAQRREVLNHQAPCASLDGKAPFEAYPAANFPLRPFAIDQEEQELDLQRIYAYLAKLSWTRSVSKSKTVSLGNKTYYIKEATPKTDLRISFDLEQKMLCFKYEKEQWEDFLPVKQLNQQWLSGNMRQQKPWPSLQLKIPFCYNFQQQNYWLRLYEE